MIRESTRRAIKKWKDNNKERMQYVKYRDTAKTYIRRATLEDVKALKQMIEELEKMAL